MENSLLEPSFEEFKKWINEALDEWNKTHFLQKRPPSTINNSSLSDDATQAAFDLMKQLKEDVAPEKPSQDLSKLLDFLYTKSVSFGMDHTQEGFCAYIPGGGIPHCILADVIMGTLNRYTGVWMCSPGLSQLEMNALKWFSNLVGYSDSSAGVFTSGGSMANFIAVMAARDNLLTEETHFKGVLYCSDQTHHCVEKAAMMAAIPARNVRKIKTDAKQRLDTTALMQAIEEDITKGLVPFMVVANCGTTNTGTIDDLTEVGNIARQYNMWYHIDGCYGGFFILTERGKTLMKGIELSNSVSLDCHKSLFFTHALGVLLTQDVAHLKKSFTTPTMSAYMPKLKQDPSLVSFCDISPELTRENKGLRAWLAIKMVGLSTFRDYLDEKLNLAEWFAVELKKMPELEVSGPQLTVITFSWKEGGVEERNKKTKDLMEGINDMKTLFLSSTSLDNIMVVRVCILHFRTHMAVLQKGLLDIQKVVHRIGTPVNDS